MPSISPRVRPGPSSDFASCSDSSYSWRKVSTRQVEIISFVVRLESISGCAAATDHAGGSKRGFHADENSAHRPIQTQRERRSPANGAAAAPAPEILPLSLFAETPEPEPKQLSKDYAPYGRLIPCELIVTVDSAAIRTPIIGLITEDVYHGGRLIIPAGTEVHGTAQTDRTRERIASGNSWTLVWKTGEELTLSGIALDRETNPDGQGWGITDGSAGLRGRLIKTDDLAEIKLFAATFLSGAASLLAERQQTIFGNSETPSLGNAPLARGAKRVGRVRAANLRFHSTRRILRPRSCRKTILSVRHPNH